MKVTGSHVIQNFILNRISLTSVNKLLPFCYEALRTTELSLCANVRVAYVHIHV